MKAIYWVFLCTIMCISVATHSWAQTLAPVNLQDILTKVLETSPRLKSAASAEKASQGGLEQAGAWINPQLDLMSENIGGSGIYNGTDAAETTFGLSQKLEIGGKINGRVAAAEQALAITKLDRSLARVTLIRDTKTAYADAVAAEEMLLLAGEQQGLAKELSGEVNERVNAAREPVIQSSKAKITLATADVAQARAAREAQHTKHVLSSLWGGHEEEYVLDASDFYALTAPPTEEEVETQLEDAIEMRRMKANESLGRARFDLEKANAIPDPTISAGVRELSATDDRAFVLALSIPIPVLNANGGNIARAQAELSKSESDTIATHLTLRNEAFEALETMRNAYEHADSIDLIILPAAEKAFLLSREGYRAGKFPYLEVLDAQRTLFAVKEQRIAALKDYHTAKAELERMTTTATTQENTHEE